VTTLYSELEEVDKVGRDLNVQIFVRWAFPLVSQLESPSECDYRLVSHINPPGVLRRHSSCIRCVAPNNGSSNSYTSAERDQEYSGINSHNTKLYARTLSNLEGAWCVFRNTIDVSRRHHSPKHDNMNGRNSSQSSPGTMTCLALPSSPPRRLLFRDK